MLTQWQTVLLPLKVKFIVVVKNLGLKLNPKEGKRLTGKQCRASKGSFAGHIEKELKGKDNGQQKEEVPAKEKRAPVSNSL